MSIDLSEVAIRKVEGDELLQWPRVLITSAVEDRQYWETTAWLVDVRLHLPCGKTIFACWCIRGFERDDAKGFSWAVRVRAAKMNVKFVEVFEVRPPLDYETMRLVEQVNKETKEELKKNTEEVTGMLFDCDIAEDFCENREAVLV